MDNPELRYAYSGLSTLKSFGLLTDIFSLNQYNFDAVALKKNELTILQYRKNIYLCEL